MKSRRRTHNVSASGRAKIARRVEIKRILGRNFVQPPKKGGR